MGVLWYGGTIYTMESEGVTVESVYTNDGKVIDVGSYQTLSNKYKDEITEQNDLNGSIMFPGFVDSHLHIIGHGEKLIHLDLSAMTSDQEVKQSLKERIKHIKEGEWIIGEGWNENQWEAPRVIHKDELDEIAPNNPMVLTRVCRHALIANSAAMKIANISMQTEDPQGGRVVRDENGVPTGYFLDTAQDYIKEGIPAVSEEYLTRVVEQAVDDLYQYGLVGGHSEDLYYYGGFKKTLNAFKQAIDGEKRKFRAHLLVHHEVFNDMISEGLVYKDGTEFIELGAMKIFADGALGGRTAWLTKPYEDDPTNSGIPIHTEQGLIDLVKQARENGMPVAVHAIGDQAVWTIANIIQNYPLYNGRRDRIIHAQIVNPELLDLLQSLDVVLDIQPTFVASDFPWIIDRIGLERAVLSYPWKTFLSRGIACAAGSDAPIEQINPLLGIEAAVLRKSSMDGKSYNKQECLSVYEAISLYTKGSAYIIGEENHRGIIAPGFTADFTVFNQDLFKIKPEKIVDTKIVMTVVDEQIVYDKYAKE
ncbi:amidohydrolase [Radiobacillus sp. PE A8.2]|uniref:amidohydrolase n=1 Tax=Radiobacillus sp. PE A8.2 TaxID=3380349 RepID=UPI0038901052